MKIIGIDPGTARMGYSIVNVSKKGNMEILETDVLVTHPDVEMHMRLKTLYQAMFKIISQHKPNIMAIERLFFNTNVKTAITVGQARGVAMLAAADWDVKVFEYTALEAKRLLTGYGRASKKEMQEAVQKSLKLDKIVKSDDANDAIAMALCHILKSKNS